MCRKIAYSQEGYDGVTRYRRPFGVYEYGVLVRANCPFSVKHWQCPLSEMDKEIK